jgi:hypothetical protein
VRTTQESLRNTLKNAKGHQFSKVVPASCRTLRSAKVSQVGFQRAGGLGLCQVTTRVTSTAAVGGFAL